MRASVYLAGALALIQLAIAAPVLARNGHDRDRDDDRRWSGYREDYHDRRDYRPSRNVVIVDSDRYVIRDYYYRSYRHCPPGLYKKRNGCRPPGHARRYVVGEVLPSYVVVEPVPRDLLVQLEPVPVGYRYVVVDNNVLLIGEATKRIVDAVVLLSAVR